ncbi:hypothetical protein D3C71_877370 [compost metagenome]
MRVTFFCFAKRKSPKKRRPPVCDPFAGAAGQTCVVSVAGCAVELTALRCSFVQTSTASQSRRHGRFDAHAHPLTAPPQAQPAGVGQPDIRTSVRAIAALGRACAARGACARDSGPSAAMARVDILSPVPLWMRRGAQGLADQGSRVFERRAAARVERDPAKPEHRRLPRSVSAGDADSGVALSLVPFFRRRERKEPKKGRLPASALNPGTETDSSKRPNNPSPAPHSWTQVAIKSVAFSA